MIKKVYIYIETKIFGILKPDKQTSLWNQLVSSIGAPQGTALAPILLILSAEICFLQKYSYDSTVVGGN